MGGEVYVDSVLGFDLPFRPFYHFVMPRKRIFKIDTYE